MGAMVAESGLERRLQQTQMRLAARFPFFGVLCLHAEHVVRPEVSTARTDGRRIEYGEAYCAALDAPTLMGLMLHEVLHCALSHVPRLRGRDPWVWNVAADIVVNEVVARLAPGIRLPAGAVRNATLAALRTEEVYRRLLADTTFVKGEGPLDLVGSLREGQDPWSAVGNGGVPSPVVSAEQEQYWKNALAVARQVEHDRGEASQLFGTTGRGSLGELLDRLVDEQLDPVVDWRVALWQHVVRSPDDFTGFDRRLVMYGLYFEELMTERLDVVVCVDTSGSVHRAMLSEFLAEVRAIVGAHAHVRATLYFADAALAGPYELSATTPLPKPRGGGGTDFRPFFARVAKDIGPHGQSVLVYLTDGFGTFPKVEPLGAVTIWAVSERGLAADRFPFGTVIRMVTS